MTPNLKYQETLFFKKYLDNVKYVPEEGLSNTIPPKLLTILRVYFWPVLSFKLSNAGSSKFEKSEGWRSYRIIMRSIGLLNIMQALDSVNSPERKQKQIFMIYSILKTLV